MYKYVIDFDMFAFEQWKCHGLPLNDMLSSFFKAAIIDYLRE